MCCCCFCLYCCRLFVSFFFFIVFSLVFFISFFRNSNISSFSTVEFRYHVVLIILVNLGKPQAIRD